MKKPRLTAPLVALAVLAGTAHADPTADALLKVLVRKGVLTQEEAAAVKAEAESEAAPPVAPVPPVPPVPPAPPAGKAPAAPKWTLNGYVQFRAVSQKYARPSTGFQDRRARLTFRSASEIGRLALSIDGAPSGASLRDAWMEWFATPTVDRVQGLNVKMGQFFKPFGFENERPDADNEFPEIPAGWSALFPGLRDVGVDFSKGLDAATRVDLAFLNGNGAGTINLTNRDNDNYKDILARISHTIPRVGSIGLTGYRGRNTIAAATGVPAFTGDRNRLGVAAILNNLGNGQLRAEYIGAREVASSLAEGPRYGTADARAWFVHYVHPVTRADELAVRYDQYDPDTHDRYRLDGDGEVNTLGVVGIHHVTEALKLSLAYERPRVTRYNTTSLRGVTRNEDVLTFQGQYRF